VLTGAIVSFKDLDGRTSYMATLDGQSDVINKIIINKGSDEEIEIAKNK
jgi:hypothetical protein